jgi:hypothetical protein
VTAAAGVASLTSAGACVTATTGEVVVVGVVVDEKVVFDGIV